MSVGCERVSVAVVLAAREGIASAIRQMEPGCYRRDDTGRLSLVRSRDLLTRSLSGIGPERVDLMTMGEEEEYLYAALSFPAARLAQHGRHSGPGRGPPGVCSRLGRIRCGPAHGWHDGPTQSELRNRFWREWPIHA